MIKDIIDEHEKAMESIKILKSRYSFSEDEIVTALVNEDFLEGECVKFFETHSQKGAKE